MSTAFVTQINTRSYWPALRWMSDFVKMATVSWPSLYSSTSRSEEHNKDRRILHSINILDGLCGLKISSECRFSKNPLVRNNESMKKKKNTFNNRVSVKRKRRTREMMLWSIGITQLAECSSQSSHACCSPPSGTLCQVLSSARKGQRVGRWRRVSIKTPPAQPSPVSLWSLSNNLSPHYDGWKEKYCPNQ